MEEDFVNKVSTNCHLYQAAHKQLSQGSGSGKFGNKEVKRSVLVVIWHYSTDTPTSKTFPSVFLSEKCLEQGS